MSPYSKQNLPFENQHQTEAPTRPEIDDDPRIPKKLNGFEKTEVKVSDINHKNKTVLCWYHDGVMAEWQLIKTPEEKEVAKIRIRFDNGKPGNTHISKEDIAVSIKIAHALFGTKRDGKNKESDIPLS